MRGPCTATGTFQVGTGAGPVVVDINKLAPGQAVTVGPSDTIIWTASAPAAATPRPVRGRIEIDLPWPFGTQTLESWTGNGPQAIKAGQYTYELTGAVPRGVKITFVGTHAEPGITCTATMSLRVSGSPFDAWIAYVAVGGLIVSGIALYIAGRASRRAV
jgi:hypothetical protein